MLTTTLGKIATDFENLSLGKIQRETVFVGIYVNTSLCEIESMTFGVGSGLEIV